MNTNLEPVISDTSVDNSEYQADPDKDDGNNKNVNVSNEDSSSSNVNTAHPL